MVLVKNDFEDAREKHTRRATSRQEKLDVAADEALGLVASRPRE